MCTYSDNNVLLMTTICATHVFKISHKCVYFCTHICGKSTFICDNHLVFTCTTFVNWEAHMCVKSHIYENHLNHTCVTFMTIMCTLKCHTCVSFSHICVDKHLEKKNNHVYFFVQQYALNDNHLWHTCVVNKSHMCLLMYTHVWKKYIYLYNF